MTESNKKFKKLLSEMEDLIMIKVPLVKNAITILENRERNDGTSCYKEIKGKEDELNDFRKIYIKIFNELMKLDKDKTKSSIKDIINTRRKLDTDYILDLKEANKGDPRDFRDIIFN